MNLYEYARSNPLFYTDPSGTGTVKIMVNHHIDIFYLRDPGSGRLSISPTLFRDSSSTMASATLKGEGQRKKLETSSASTTPEARTRLRMAP